METYTGFYVQGTAPAADPGLSRDKPYPAVESKEDTTGAPPDYRVEISEEAQALLGRWPTGDVEQGAAQGSGTAESPEEPSADAKNDIEDPQTTHAPNGKELSDDEIEEIEELEKRDREVRAHEQAHVAAGARNATYEYETGPDGMRYATGGHADINTSKTGDPEKDIDKAQKVKRAALAPKDPSPKDRQVAREAELMEAEARRELTEQKSEELSATLGLSEIPSGTPTQTTSSGASTEATEPQQPDISPQETSITTFDALV